MTSKTDEDALYQDEWRNGRLVVAGRRPCYNRYSHIAPVLKEMHGRGFSVADVGGFDAYFLRRLEEDFGTQGTLVEFRDCDLSGYNIAHNQMLVTGSNVQKIGKHDVIMALSVFHHMPDWESVYDQLKLLCKSMIVEAAHPNELKGPRPSRTIRRAEGWITDQYERFTQDASSVLCEEASIDMPLALRPTVLIKCAVDGTVEEGKGGASWLMPRDAAFWEPLGFLPYPGTFNVNVGQDNQAWFKAMDGVEIEGIKYVPARVNGMGGYVRFVKNANVVEFLSQYRLRDVLDVATGDTVEVRPR